MSPAVRNCWKSSTPGFLDPVDYRGQLVTVVGPITGTDNGKIGETAYKYMVMQVTGYKRWRVVQQVVMPPEPMDPWMWGGGYRWRTHPAPWGFYNQEPGRVESVVTE